MPTKRLHICTYFSIIIVPIKKKKLDLEIPVAKQVLIIFVRKHNVFVICEYPPPKLKRQFGNFETEESQLDDQN